MLTIKPLLILILILFCFSAFGQKQDSIIVRFDTTKLISYNKEGKIRNVEIIVNGRIVDWTIWHYTNKGFGYKKYRPSFILYFPYLWRDFYPSGALKMEGNIKKGKLHGKYITYYESGQQQCDCHYKSGKQDSIQMVYYESGKMNGKQYYVNGKQEGEQFGYSETGELCFIENFKNGKLEGKSTIYFKSGQVWTEKIYKNGLLWNVLINQDNSGKQMDKGTIKDGNGTVKIYSENGVLDEIEYYKKGKLIRVENQH